MRMALKSVRMVRMMLIDDHYPPAASLTSLINERFTVADKISGREPSSYIQSIIVMLRMPTSTHLQRLTWAWRNLDPALKQDINQPTEETSLSNFLEEIEGKKCL